LKVATTEGAPYASPLNIDDVKTGKYPIARPLNQYVNGMPKGETRDFIEFELSPEGQKIVEEEGFFPIPKEYVDYNKKQAGI
jgi:phosphate transport system substrate-binding protein